MFGIGTQELLICMVVCLILFGNRLPSVMRSMGQSVKSFQDGLRSSDEDAANA
jgi:sec-independent protein translocase protein TatA